MMKTMFQKIALLAVLVTGLGAHAGILIEPYLGYGFGKNSGGQIHGSAAPADHTATGVTFGGRLGYQMLGFMGGIDYMTGKWSDNSTPSVDITPNDLGVFVGFNFPVLVRVYGVYNIQTKMDTSVSGTSGKWDGGDGIKLGVGFTGLPFVSINLEYLAQSFKKMNGVALDSTMNAKMYMLSVSLPLDL